MSRADDADGADAKSHPFLAPFEPVTRSANTLKSVVPHFEIPALWKPFAFIWLLLTLWHSQFPKAWMN